MQGDQSAAAGQLCSSAASATAPRQPGSQAAPSSPGAAPPRPWCRRCQVGGQAVLAELQRQRGVIQRAQQQAQQAGANVGQAEGLLKKMSSWWRL